MLNSGTKKVFENLPEHKKVKVVATAHLFDNWEGESLKMLIESEKVWSKKTTAKKNSKAPDMCGDSAYGDPDMNLKIEKEIKHTGNNLVLEFDTNMKNKDPCKASYAIDDIMIYYQ